MSHEAAAEVDYDRLDDQGQLNAAEMREVSGFVPDGDNDTFTVEAIRDRNPEQELAVDAARERWLAKLSISAPSSEGPLPPEKTPEQKAEVDRQIDRLKGLIEPSRLPDAS